MQVAKDSGKDIEILKNSPIWQKKVNKITAISLFLIQCSWPVVFYFTFIQCGNILKTQFGFTAEEVIHQNFIVSSAHLVICFLIVYFKL
ncbi:MAG: hypothetical protein RCG15_08540 [Candidatus Rickettsia vulgarisii]